MDSVCGSNVSNDFDAEYDRGYVTGYEQGTFDKENRIEEGLEKLKKKHNNESIGFRLGLERGYFRTATVE